MKMLVFFFCRSHRQPTKTRKRVSTLKWFRSEIPWDLAQLQWPTHTLHRPILSNLGNCNCHHCARVVCIILSCISFSPLFYWNILQPVQKILDSELIRENIKKLATSKTLIDNLVSKIGNRCVCVWLTFLTKTKLIHVLCYLWSTIHSK